MSDFRTIPDSINQEAAEILRAVSGKGPRPEIEVTPGFEAMIAGAAIALERAAPHALYDSRTTSAEDWLKEGSDPWRMFHAAAARAIDLVRRDEAPFGTSEELISHLVADTLNQAAAKRMTMAIENSDPVFKEHLSLSQRATVEYARTDPEVAQSIRYESYGAYSQLPAEDQRELARQIAAGTNLTDAMWAEIRSIDETVFLANASNDAYERNREIARHLGDYRDLIETGVGRPLFTRETAESISRVYALAEGAQPQGPVETGIVAHMLVTQERDALVENVYARALVDLADRETDSIKVAVRLEAERAALDEAREVGLGTRAETTAHIENAARVGGPCELTPRNQMQLFQEIEQGERVSPLFAMRLAEAAIAVESGELTINRGFTYENITAEQANKFSLNGLHLPGEKVRFDRRIALYGKDTEAIRAKLGEEPLEIARTLIVGTTISNGMGGTAPAILPEYEFVGHEGRFPAKLFQHERGDEHVYGVIMTHGDEMWLAPLDVSADLDNDTKTLGLPRRIESNAAGKEELFAELRDSLIEGPVSGEFMFRPQAYGRTDGPVELIDSPWMTKAGEREVEAASAAIGAEAARQAGHRGQRQAHLTTSLGL